MDKGHSHKKCKKKKERGIQELANVNNKLDGFSPIRSARAMKTPVKSAIIRVSEPGGTKGATPIWKDTEAVRGSAKHGPMVR